MTTARETRIVEDSGTAPKESSLTEKSVVLTIARLISESLLMLIPLLLVRIFSKEDFGVYRITYLIHSTFLMLGEMGISQSLYYFLPRESGRKSVLMWQTFFLTMLSGIVVLCSLLLFRRYISGFFYSPGMGDYIPVLAWYSFFRISSSFLEISMIAERKIRLASTTYIFMQFTEALCLISAGLTFRTVMSVVAASVVFGGLRFLYVLAYLLRHYPFVKDVFKLRSLKLQLSYSLSLGSMNLSFNIKDQLHRYFVSHFFNPVVFAVYSVGTYRLSFAEIPANMVTGVLASHVSGLEKTGRHKEILETWKEAVRKTSIFLVPLVIFLFVMAEEFIASVFSPKYCESAILFRISVVSLYLIALRPNIIVQAFARTRFMRRVALLQLPLEFFVLYSMMLLSGINGIAAATVLTLALTRLVYLIKGSRLLGVSLAKMIPWKQLARISLFSSLALIPLGLLSVGQLSLLTRLLLGCLLYFGCYCFIAWYFGLVTDEDKWIVRHLLRKYLPRDLFEWCRKPDGL